MNLEQKQKYYDYNGEFYYRQPPRLDNCVIRELRDIDPDYRLIFGGVAVIRKNENDERPYIRGDERATKINLGRIQPRYIEIKIQQAKALCYRHKKGHIVRVAREDQVPNGKHCWWESQFVDYGRPRWFLERKLSPEQLVAAGIYHEKDVTLPREGDWVWRLTVETPDGRYWEPDRDWLQMIRKHVWEMNNERLSDLLIRDLEAHEKRELIQQSEKAERDAVIMEDIVSRALRAPRNRIILLPPPPGMQRTI